MKLHVPAMCLAGVLASAIGASAQTTSDRMRHDSDTYTTYEKRSQYFVLWGEPLYHRIMLYPDLVSKSEIADKLSTIIENQRHEVAEISTFAGRSRSVGYTNVATVYDYMAGDHQRLIDFAANWLTERNFPVPVETTTTAVAELAPRESIHHMLEMHVAAFNRALDQLKTEKSSTVRGALLMAATTSARHITLLRSLDRDVEGGRRTMSAFLQGQLGNESVAVSSEYMDRIIIEETEFINLHFGTPAVAYNQQVIEQVVEVERTVEVERIVERPVEVERVVERVVEKPVYITRPTMPTQSRVAGRRQSTMTSRRARRPAR